MKCEKNFKVLENEIRKLKTEVDKCHSFIEKQGMMAEYNRYSYEESEQ